MVCQRAVGCGQFLAIIPVCLLCVYLKQRVAGACWPEPACLCQLNVAAVPQASLVNPPGCSGPGASAALQAAPLVTFGLRAVEVSFVGSVSCGSGVCSLTHAVQATVGFLWFAWSARKLQPPEGKLPSVSSLRPLPPCGPSFVWWCVLCAAEVAGDAAVGVNPSIATVRSLQTHAACWDLGGFGPGVCMTASRSGGQRTIELQTGGMMTGAQSRARVSCCLPTCRPEGLCSGIGSTAARC